MDPTQKSPFFPSDPPPLFPHLDKINLKNSCKKYGEKNQLQLTLCKIMAIKFDVLHLNDWLFIAEFLI